MGEEVAYCIGAPGAAGTCVGVEILGGDEHLARLHGEGHRRAFVAIGDNRRRDALAASVIALGYRLVNAISPTAVISPSATLGSGVAVMAGAVVNAETRIDDLVIVNTGATIDHDCQIGRAAHIAPQCALAGNVVVGQFTFLGVGCNVIPEQSIGQGVMLGAGSVVIRDIRDHCTAVGVPAVIIKDRAEEPS
jgi:UDP-perosamine 4-acetyltransferase